MRNPFLVTQVCACERSLGGKSATCFQETGAAAPQRGTRAGVGGWGIPFRHPRPAESLQFRQERAETASSTCRTASRCDMLINTAGRRQLTNPWAHPGMAHTKGLLPCAALDALLTQPHESKSEGANARDSGPHRQRSIHGVGGSQLAWTEYTNQLPNEPPPHRHIKVKINWTPILHRTVPFVASPRSPLEHVKRFRLWVIGFYTHNTRGKQLHPLTGWGTP